MKRVWVVSGASRGIGAAIVSAAQAQGDYVIGISRGKSAADLSLQTNFAHPEQVTLPALPEADQYILVNNAGMVDPVGSDYSADDAVAAINVNLTAAIALTRLFLRQLADKPVRKLVINISSGAATGPVAGWSLYCAAKAGLDHFGRVVAVEQKQLPYPADVLGVSPGKVDTDMQTLIRSCDSEQFPLVDYFRAEKEDGNLISAEKVAKEIHLAVASGRHFDGEVIHISKLNV